jgi:hypothetical protein
MILSKGGYFQMGVWAFARHDIGEITVTSESGGRGAGSTFTDYKLGGFQAGVALRLGTIVEG